MQPLMADALAAAAAALAPQYTDLDAPSLMHLSRLLAQLGPARCPTSAVEALAAAMVSCWGVCGAARNINSLMHLSRLLAQLGPARCSTSAVEALAAAVVSIHILMSCNAVVIVYCIVNQSLDVDMISNTSGKTPPQSIPPPPNPQEGRMEQLNGLALARTCTALAFQRYQPSQELWQSAAARAGRLFAQAQVRMHEVARVGVGGLGARATGYSQGEGQGEVQD